MERKIGRSLARDRKRRTEEAGAVVEELMKAEPPSPKRRGTAFRGGTRRRLTAPHHPLELRSGG